MVGAAKCTCGSMARQAVTTCYNCDRLSRYGSAAMQPAVLFVLTNHDRIGDADDESAEPTGFHLYEAAQPWATLIDSGVRVDIVTPEGGPAPIDPSSREGEEPESRRFHSDPNVAAALENSRALSTVNLDDYEGIYFPGGYGAMWDLPVDDSVRNAVERMLIAGKPVAAVCHGPAALVNARRRDGSWIVDQHSIACFTDEEERAMEKDTKLPFLLASRLEARGAKLRSAANFEASMAVDRLLITGQNPASANGVGLALRDRILSSRRADD